MECTGKTVIVVGSGLEAGVLALLLDRMLPHSDVMLVSEEPMVGGAHQKPVLLSAIPNSFLDLFDPLIVKAWSTFCVEGALRSERFNAQLVLLAGEQLHVELLERFAPSRLRLSTPIARVSHQSIHLASGEILSAREVVDVRQQGSIVPLAKHCPRYSVIVRDLDQEQPHGLAEPVLYSELERSVEGIVFAQYLPLTATMLREVIYSPEQIWVDDGPTFKSTGTKVLRMERTTIAAGELFDGNECAGCGADAVNVASLLDGGIGSLALQANQIAARQIRIVA
ncbi:hypothetical protein HFP51_09870 [Parasphingopyxis sp. CP4]|uniref:hypothetical protein n=1 Tax=Parasphingopyxis sp. CP4 TaxID=2724527 RepID=UPI0015A0E9BB|nr:hypothetical protein [Parasphingopyxis sp. CP4]QLC22460.1 hypothetical protein HFP51_09870 [Parasphingopyxis sp. CP4]